MKESLAKLSASFSRLSSVERWFIIIAIIVVFAVVNFVFVFPRFNDWSVLTNRMSDAREKLKKYEDMIAQTPSFSNQITKLEGENSAVPQEDQAINFLTAIQGQAVQSGVSIQVNNRSPERTNQFFLERAQTLSTQSGEAQLVDFLYNLGTGSSLIRVRALSISRDPTQQQLKANMTLIASFQKKPAVRTTNARPAATPAAPKATSKDTPKPAVKPGVPATPASPKPSTTKK
jgi:Tfp pilus assembly protein PilO